MSSINPVVAGPTHGPGRIEALSDGVFAVALTLLTFDLVAAAKGIEEGERLGRHLLHEWPTFVSYLVGFLTILVCWINHRCVFHYVTRADSGLEWVNGLQLALVAAVPLPTAILAEHIGGPDRRTAMLIYGATFLLMAASFWVLSGYVQRRGLVDVSSDPERYRGLRTNYALAMMWTILCLVVAWVILYPALLMWALMFAVFAFPREFAGFTASRRRRA